MSALLPLKIGPEDAWGFTPIDRWLCRKRIASLSYGPVYTPPSLKGTILQPSPAGGANWGGGAYDPKSHIMVVPTNRVPMVVTLIPRENAAAAQEHLPKAKFVYLFPNEGVPYVVKLEPLLSPIGAPCTPPPWASLTAVDMVTGAIRWEVPLGSIEKEAPVPIPWELGTPGAGGPLITAGGLVFIGYATDSKFRAVNLLSGKTVWKTTLPAAAMSTPVTYKVNGEQYVVITAGGHSMYGAPKGDAVMAYKLKQQPAEH
jgi:quinoprotein glucose dehydrogenase